MKTKQQLQSIIDNAPSGANHVEQQLEDSVPTTFDYLMLDENDNWHYHANKKWHILQDSPLDQYYSIRSLSDIQAQIDLMNKVEQLEQDNNKLKAHNDTLCNDLTSICDNYISQLEGK